MKVITTYSLKGGSGKTTLAVLIAQYLLHKGHSVALLDSDTNQKSLLDWANNNQAVNVPCYLIQDELTEKDLNDFPNVDFVIIDGTPRTNAYVKSVLSLADYIVIPVQPTQIAVTSLLQDNHLSLLAEIEENNPNTQINVVINGATQHNTKEIKDVKEILTETGFNVLATLGQRKAFVIDYDKPFMQCSNSKALNELGYLVDKMLEK
ncbi:chromosome partitioning protein [Pasteurellaceae bacterium LFhippo2]|nr:chromosome partitioning protein [Pasteurellaceae bacterium LFhippo2]